MAIDFPNTPTIGQKYPASPVAGTPTYTWDGVKWTTVGAAIAGKTAVLTDGSLPMAAGLTVIAPPVNPTDAAAKSYVDGAIRFDAAQSLTSSQQQQARQNAYASPLDALAYNGMQINGGIEVSQENGTSQIYGGPGGTTINKYMADGWIILSQGVQSISWSAGGGGAASSPPGYPGYSSAWTNVANASPAAGDYPIIRQNIEGYRVAHLAWGTANAQPISIGFWFFANAGTYSGAARGASGNRSYVFTFTVNATNTWEWKTVTIPGDTAGTWLITNGVGIELSFTLMAGTGLQTTAGVWQTASFYAATGTINSISTTAGVWGITGLIVLPGIQLPSAARAPFIMRPYDQELLLCSRYFQFNRYREPGFALDGTELVFTHTPLVPYRAAPTCSLSNTTVAFECPPWTTGITMTGAVAHGDHMLNTGGDYKMSGTPSPALPAINTWAHITSTVVKFLTWQTIN